LAEFADDSLWEQALQGALARIDESLRRVS